MSLIDHIMGLADRSVRSPALRRTLTWVWHALEDITDGDVLARNDALRSRYAGERCFILGTGASLNEIDFRLLAGEYTFGCNLLIRHPDFAKLDLKFYAAMDPFYRLLKDPDPTVRPRAFYPAIEAACRGHDTIVFLSASARRFVDSNKLFDGSRVHYVRGARSMGQARVQVNDLRRRVTFIDGTVFFMIGTAIYMGFRELYLCGCGYTYEPFQHGYFYGDWGAIDGKAVDNRHRIAKSFAEARGVLIRNVVPEGFTSPVYETVRWRWVVDHALGQRRPHTGTTARPHPLS